MGVLMMLATIGLLGLAFVLLIISFWKKLPWLRKFVFGAAPVWLVIYAVVLFGFSLVSKETVLTPGQPKAFCGFYLDCHMHAELVGVRTAKEIGGTRAQGTFVIAKVRVFSDAKNPNIAFRLLQPQAELHDEGGRIYTRMTDAESQLPTGSINLGSDIKGKETIEKEIVFDVTEPAKNMKLSVTEGYGIDKYIEAVLIDDEDSILHKPTVFKVEAQTVTAEL